MSVLLCLVIAPLGLLMILGMSWFEDRVLRPPTGPAETVLLNKVVLSKPVQGQVVQQSVQQPLQRPALGVAEPLHLVRADRQPPALPQTRDTAA